ncbi:hypothetical protein OSB04_024477 [Centaurea solstitialis]|uniref:Uncharacterized protein n=1 Tax=Centaurea solstitialis TaxID=347529 RepID=A0AA38SL71_9ASTR|nr:hypothetical protein OSB04_024477 [Centaurea solstitialis]
MEKICVRWREAAADGGRRLPECRWTVRLLRKEAETLAYGHIKNALSSKLFDLYAPIKCPRKLWKALEHKYKALEEGTSKYLVSKYLRFQMVDDKPILEQVYELQVLVNKMNLLSISIPEIFQEWEVPCLRETGHYVIECKLRKLGPSAAANAVAEIGDLAANLTMNEIDIIDITKQIDFVNLDREGWYLDTRTTVLGRYRRKWNHVASLHFWQHAYTKASPWSGIQGSDGTIVFMKNGYLIEKAYQSGGMYRLSLKESKDDSEESAGNGSFIKSYGNNMVTVNEVVDGGS